MKVEIKNYNGKKTYQNENKLYKQVGWASIYFKNDEFHNMINQLGGAKAFDYLCDNVKAELESKPDFEYDEFSVGRLESGYFGVTQHIRILKEIK